MDRDEGSIGGIKNPMAPTFQLFIVTVCMDAAAVALSMIISLWFAILVLAYILASRAYSYRGIRLKKFPIIGFLTVAIFQGGISFLMIYHGASANKTLEVPVILCIVSALLIGGFYPLTQIYQHQADKNDGVISISYMLGYRGTFVFTGLIYSVAMGLLAQYFYSINRPDKFCLLATVMLPVPVYFLWWAVRVWTDIKNASFTYTMRMNVIASIFTNIGFLSLLIKKAFE